ncbi:SDR family NAD(P)-dependent oxidoreductase [Streptosporangium sp. NPDC004631]
MKETSSGRLRFDGRVAVVTGAGAGLGRAHALALAARGARVIVNDLGPGTGETDRAGGVVEEVRALGGTATAHRESIATAEGCRSLVEAAVAAYGRLDIVVNNAGIIQDRTIQNLSPETLEPVLAVHLHGTAYLMAAAWPLFKAQSYGRLVNTTSASGLFGNFGQAAYAAAKAGIVGLTRVAALEGARHGIRANAVAPVARTDMTAGMLGELAASADPALVSPAVVYLSHERCSLNGEVLAVGAGRVARTFVAETRGVVRADLTPETVEADLQRICSEEGYATPSNLQEESRLILSLLNGASGADHR